MVVEEQEEDDDDDDDDDDGHRGMLNDSATLRIHSYSKTLRQG